MSFQVPLHPSSILVLLTHAGKNTDYVSFIFCYVHELDLSSIALESQ